MFYNYDIFDDALRLRNIFDNYFTRARAFDRDYEEPRINMYEDGDIITIKALMPGVKQEDLNVELADRSISISGEKKNSDSDKKCLRQERKFGKFGKSINLPFDVNRDSVKATLADGIFTITLEKSEHMKSRKIEIQ